METTSTRQEKQGISTFIPLPIEELKKENVYTNQEASTNAEVIAMDIPLGIKGGKTLIDCEKGIKSFVKDYLVKQDFLPNTETAVWVYYLTQGIIRDFGRTWEGTPICLQEKQTKAEKNYVKGKRVLSKKDKNELLEKLTYQYYEADVNSGKISQAEAFASMADAAARKKELEDAGYFLSPKKTEGVEMFDWKKEINETHNNTINATKLYTKNKINVVIPNVVENFYTADAKATKLAKEIGKSPLVFTKGVVEIVAKGQDKYETNAPEIKSNSDLSELLNTNPKYATTINKITEGYIIKGFHITKIMKSGMMEPRQVCIDCISKKGNEQHLFLFEKDGSVLHLNG